jgi:arylsulfatase A-like enzyme
LEVYKDLGLLERTTIFVTALSGSGGPKSAANGTSGQASADLPRVPWIASGVGIKSGYEIHRPVSILDTGATVMRALGLHTHTEWDSHAVEEIFRVAARTESPPSPQQ